jgi:hypothetical protein
MKILGIDPGKSGAWCHIDCETGLTEFGGFDFDENDLLSSWNVPVWDYACIERVRPIPGKMGCMQSYTMGLVFGQLHRMILYQPHILATPQQWQKFALLGVPANKNPKVRSRQGFERICGTGSAKRLDHNATDAFHIARYCAHYFGFNSKPYHCEHDHEKTKTKSD